MRVAFLFAFCASQAAATVDPRLTDVFTSGSEGYACYRIPAMSRTANGTLLLFSEGRFYDCNDHGYVDIVVKASTDGGASWGPLRVVHSESSRAGENVTIGNAAPVVLSSGRILLPFCRNNIQVGVLFSDDSGDSWALLANITVPSGWTWVATGPPGSLELSANGRVIIPSNHIISGAGASHVFMSDDGGVTWAISASIPGGNEDQAALLSWISPMSILLSMRQVSGSHRIAALSSDGGSTWGTSWQTVTETKCEASMVALPSHQDGPLLVQSSAFNVAARENMTLHVSSDNGRTWVATVQVYAGPAAYSTLVAVSNSTVALAFERDGYQHISFISPLL